MNKTRKIITSFLIIALIFCSGLIVKEIADNIMIKAKAKEAEEQIIIAKKKELLEILSNNENVEEVIKEEIKPDYSEFKKQNSDTVGWITVPNTNINYPVVQGKDNDYYLKHDFEKASNKNGAVFMDYRNNPTNLNTNTIIYAHNTYSDTMFSDLVRYQDIEFLKENPIITFDTMEAYKKWVICAVFITNAVPEDDNGYVFNYICPEMGESFKGYKEEVLKRSLYSTGVDFNSDDEILTLSTCCRDLDLYNKNGVRTYRANARIVIIAKALENNESGYGLVDNAKENPSPKYPQLYYDKYGIQNPYKADARWYPTSN